MRNLSFDYRKRPQGNLRGSFLRSERVPPRYPPGEECFLHPDFRLRFRIFDLHNRLQGSQTSASFRFGYNEGGLRYYSRFRQRLYKEIQVYVTPSQALRAHHRTLVHPDTGRRTEFRYLLYIICHLFVVLLLYAVRLAMGFVLSIFFAHSPHLIFGFHFRRKQNWYINEIPNRAILSLVSKFYDYFFPKLIFQWPSSTWLSNCLSEEVHFHNQFVAQHA